VGHGFDEEDTVALAEDEVIDAAMGALNPVDDNVLVTDFVENFADVLLGDGAAGGAQFFGDLGIDPRLEDGHGDFRENAESDEDAETDGLGVRENSEKGAHDGESNDAEAHPGEGTAVGEFASRGTEVSDS
jgi:hypothetical protein